MFDQDETEGASVIICHGSLACEGALLERVKASLDELEGGHDELMPPIRVVVPTRSLRGHLIARILHSRDRACVGIKVQTLFGLALEALEQAGRRPAYGWEAAKVLIRREARAHEAFAGALDDLSGGYEAVVATVSDLLDAGLDAAHEDALMECIEAAFKEGRCSAGDQRRARALVEVASRVRAQMEELGIGPPSRVYKQAAEAIRMDPDGLVPARQIYVYGFVDVTSPAGDLLELLVRVKGARVFLDIPPDPAFSGTVDTMAQRFAQRLMQRLSAFGMERIQQNPLPPKGPSLEMIQASGAEAEVRVVARRICSLLDAGVVPESIGVVCRDLDPYVIPLRTHFHRLGIPFSALGAKGPVHPLGRRWIGLLELMEQREEAPCDRWLDALGGFPSEAIDQWDLPARADLMLALRTAGVGRMGELRDMDTERIIGEGGEFVLPVLDGPAVEDPQGLSASPSWARPKAIPAAFLVEAKKAAQFLLGHLQHWPARAPMADHVEELEGLVRGQLGWRDEDAALSGLMWAIRWMVNQVPPSMELQYEELCQLLRSALEERSRPPLGGQGGGVQVLEVMEARGRTFGALFVMGLNRDVFPRAIREDPLLQDSVRIALSGVLPDMAIKRRGHEEERYLFSQLLSSSPYVCLSWQVEDEDGTPRLPSPLVERLRIHGTAPKTNTAPPITSLSLIEDGGAPIMPAMEHAILVGLAGKRDTLRDVLRLALCEQVARHGIPSVHMPDPQDVARGRMDVLDEMDPDWSKPEGLARSRRLGPYFGFVGRPVLEEDPRRGRLFITTVEGVAACPWQAFLRRILRVQRVPDPMEALPRIQEQVRGAVVHAVLERVVREALPRCPRILDDAVRQGGALVRWPTQGRLKEIVEEEVHRATAVYGTSSLGLARALMQQVWEYLEQAREADRAEKEEVRVLGAELKCEIPWEGPQGIRWIAFRVDRADQVDEKGIRLTDYKTGRHFSSAAKASTIKNHLLSRLKEGQWMQAAIYARAQLPEKRRLEGRFLFLRPDLKPHQRELSLTEGDESHMKAFEKAIGVILEAIDQGVFFPRLVDRKGSRELPRCGYCEVSEACIRGDSGARWRLLRWVKEGEPRDGDGAIRALRRLWNLGTDEKQGEEIQG